MNIESLIFFLILCIFSWLSFVVIHKNINHVTDSHLRILGEENKNLIKTVALFRVRMFYGISLLAITVAALIFFMNS